MTGPHRALVPRALYVLSLFTTALVFGLTLCHVLQAPGSRGLEPREWLDVQHTFYGGFAILGGSAEILGLLASAGLGALLLRRRSRAATPILFAASCLFGTLLVYWFGNRPVNGLIAEWTPQTLPADWSTYRDLWENAHALSTVLAGLAFIAVITAMRPLALWESAHPPRFDGRGHLPDERHRRTLDGQGTRREGHSPRRDGQSRV